MNGGRRIQAITAPSKRPTPTVTGKPNAVAAATG
jgi:hypothetical protein